jgi:SNF2 family DNA or RNA helicase
MREFELLPGAKERINALVAPMIMRMGAEDYLKLPKELERRHYVELPAAARKDYDAVEEKLMGTLFTRPLVTAAAARSKCAQIANGAVYLDPTPEDERWPSHARPVKVVHTAKVDALVDLYEELQGEPILVMIGFHHDVVAIRKAIGSDIPCINGGVTKTQASDYIARWNKGTLPILLGHAASMSHGLNLQKFSARHVAFFHIPDDLDQYEQAYKRVNRQGNKAEFVMRHLFIARATVDVPKMRNLERKGTTQQDFLKAMKEYDLERQKERGGRKRG